MRRMGRFAIVPLVAAVAGLGFAQSGGARADQVPGFDIEAQDLYCIYGGTNCTDIGSNWQQSLYIEAQAVSFVPGQTSGRPSAVDFTCGRGSYVDAFGIPHITAMHSFAGYDPGTISGTASLGPNPTEGNTAAISTLTNVRAYDATTGDTGIANGTMVSNNVTDLPVRLSGFTVTMWGPIYDEAFGPEPTVQIGYGSMKCTSTPTYVPNSFAAGPYFEGVLGNTDND